MFVLDPVHKTMEYLETFDNDVCESLSSVSSIHRTVNVAEPPRPEKDEPTEGSVMETSATAYARRRRTDQSSLRFIFGVFALLVRFQWSRRS